VKTDKSKLMKAAWKIARKASVRFGGTARSFFSESLKTAWTIKESEKLHTIVMKFGNWDTRRYGKPFASIISLNNGRPDYDPTGYFVGKIKKNNGSGEIIIREVRTGAIVAFSQKDMRWGSYQENKWYEVQADGNLKYISKSDGIKCLYFEKKDDN